MKKNWVFSVTVIRPLREKETFRHYLNGMTQEQAAHFAQSVLEKNFTPQGTGGFIVGLTLAENFNNNDGGGE